MSQKKQYIINSVNRPLKGMNRIDERWNMHPQFYYDLLNGYVTKSASGQTLIKQRYGLKRISSNAITNITSITSNPGVRALMYWKRQSLWVAIGGDGKIYALDPNVNTWVSKTAALNGSMNLIEYGSYLVQPNSNDQQYLGKFDNVFNATKLSSDSNMTGGGVMYNALLHNGRIITAGSTSDIAIYGSKKDGATDNDGWSLDNDWFSLQVSKYFSNYSYLIGMKSILKDMVLFGYKDGILIFNIPVNVPDIQLYQKIEIPMLGASYECLSVKIGGEYIIATKPGLKSLTIALSDERFDENDLSKNIKYFWNSLVDYMSGPFPYNPVPPWNFTQIPIITYVYPILFYSNKFNQIWVSLPQRIPSYITGVGYTGQTDQYIIDNPDYKSQVLVYSVESKEFVGRYEFPFNITSMCEHPISNDIYIGADNGYLFRYDEDTYYDEILSNGTPGNSTIPFSFKPSYIGTDYSDIYKALTDLSALCETNKACDLTLSYNTQPIGDNQESALTAIDETVSLQAGAALNYDYDLIGRGKLIDLEFHHNVSGARVVLGEIKLNCNLEGKF